MPRLAPVTIATFPASRSASATLSPVAFGRL